MRKKTILYVVVLSLFSLGKSNQRPCYSSLTSANNDVRQGIILVIIVAC